MKEYSQISLTQNIKNQTFIELSNRIQSEFGGRVVNDLSDLDSKYRDFLIKGNRITLHENTFTGISIFPTKLAEAEKDENLVVEQLGFNLKYRKLNRTTWTKFRNDGEYEINYLLENIHYCRAEIGNYEFNSYEQYNGGCDEHDHCQICSTMISCKVPDNKLYSSPRNIVCVECYNDFISENDYLDKIDNYEKFEKPIKGKTERGTWLNQIIKVFSNENKNTDNKR